MSILVNGLGLYLDIGAHCYLKEDIFKGHFVGLETQHIPVSACNALEKLTSDIGVLFHLYLVIVSAGLSLHLGSNFPNAGNCADDLEYLFTGAVDPCGVAQIVGNGFCKVFGSIICCDNALIDDNYSVADCLYLGQDMGRKDNGMLLSQPLDKVSYIKYLLRVKTYSRLVENKYLRISNDCCCKTDSLLITL